MGNGSSAFPRREKAIGDAHLRASIRENDLWAKIISWTNLENALIAFASGKQGETIKKVTGDLEGISYVVIDHRRRATSEINWPRPPILCDQLPEPQINFKLYEFNHSGTLSHDRKPIGFGASAEANARTSAIHVE